MEPVINIENLGKKYVLRHQAGTRYSTLRDAVTEKANSLVKREETGLSSREEFWALKGVTFGIQEGERVGIIGRNGAGKSTLLKVLSRITEPTEGRITITGNLASLLEVGTGFHPELSGRENIFLNGSILGMSKAEIRKKFDEIVSFAEVEKFLDTPVKRYSSGMYVRMAFAVAAHLEPDILIVDEVLAVGDSAFQKKCLGKMKEVSGEGRTVLFVSHNMEAIQRLCTSAVLLDKGKLLETGPVDRVVNQYLNLNANRDVVFEIPLPENHAQLPGYVCSLQVEDGVGKVTGEIPMGAPWQVRIRIRLNTQVPELIVGLGVSTSFDMPLRTSWTHCSSFEKGSYEVIFKGDDIMLTEGQYKLIVGLSSGKRAFQYLDPAGFLSLSDVSSLHNDQQIVNTKSGLIINQMQSSIIRTGN